MNVLVVSIYSQADTESCVAQYVAYLLSSGKSVAWKASCYALSLDLTPSENPDVVIYDRDDGATEFDEVCVFAFDVNVDDILAKYQNIPMVWAPNISPDPVTDIETRTKYIKRSVAIYGGLTHNGYQWQTRRDDLDNINGRVSKLNSLLLLGRIAKTDTTYLDSNGDLRDLIWTTEDNIDVLFTVQEFLEFGIAVDEFVEDRYKEARVTTS